MICHFLRHATSVLCVMPSRARASSYDDESRITRRVCHSCTLLTLSNRVGSESSGILSPGLRIHAIHLSDDRLEVAFDDLARAGRLQGHTIAARGQHEQ